MRPDASKQARDALDALERDEVQEVLGFLCGSRPEAVLAAVAALASHRAVVAQLRGRPPAQRS